MLSGGGFDQFENVVDGSGAVELESQLVAAGTADVGVCIVETGHYEVSGQLYYIVRFGPAAIQ